MKEEENNCVNVLRLTSLTTLSTDDYFGYLKLKHTSCNVRTVAKGESDEERKVEKKEIK